MNIKYLTQGQKEALLRCLENQKSPKTTAESSMLNKLREYFGVVCYGDNSAKFLRCGNFVKQIEADTFGDHYKFRWIAVKRSDLGEYITASYFGNKRVYLN